MGIDIKINCKEIWLIKIFENWISKIKYHNDGEEEFRFQLICMSQLFQMIEPFLRLQTRLCVQISETANETGPLLVRYGRRRRRRNGWRRRRRWWCPALATIRFDASQLGDFNLLAGQSE